MGNFVYGRCVRLPWLEMVSNAFQSKSVMVRITDAECLGRLYIIEGCITVVWAGICVFVIPKSYETAYFLNDDDKALMRQRAELMESYSGGSGHYGKKEIKEAAKDAKSWLHGVTQIAVVTILYGKSEPENSSGLKRLDSQG